MNKAKKRAAKPEVKDVKKPKKDKVQDTIISSNTGWLFREIIANVK